MLAHSYDTIIYHTIGEPDNVKDVVCDLNIIIKSYPYMLMAKENYSE